MSELLLTIFTPTYNRADTLPRLHDSLLAQTESDFEWIVVDDGSNDDTGELVRGWANGSPFPIRYLRQENAGKHVAHNLGARESAGLYFLCVDSDDWLEPNAVATVRRDAQALDTEAGLLYPRLFATQKALDTSDWFPNGTDVVELSDMRMRHGLVIETAIVFRTDVLRRHPFPVIESEYYIPEEAAYFDYRAPELFHVHSDCFYRCKYLEEGLTKNIWANWYHNPEGTKLALHKRYETACRYSGPRALREKISAVCGIESLNMALGKDISDGSSGSLLLRILLIPLSLRIRAERFADIERSHS